MNQFKRPKEKRPYRNWMVEYLNSRGLPLMTPELRVYLIGDMKREVERMGQLEFQNAITRMEVLLPLMKAVAAGVGDQVPVG